jgi:hypothetical protein
VTLFVRRSGIEGFARDLEAASAGRAIVTFNCYNRSPPSRV